jgi:transposase
LASDFEEMVERLDEVARRSIGIKVSAARFMLSMKGVGELTVAAILGEASTFILQP